MKKSRQFSSKLDASLLCARVSSSIWIWTWPRTYNKNAINAQFLYSIIHGVIKRFFRVRNVELCSHNEYLKNKNSVLNVRHFDTLSIASSYKLCPYHCGCLIPACVPDGRERQRKTAQTYRIRFDGGDGDEQFDWRTFDQSGVLREQKPVRESISEHFQTSSS